jgi:hypothetical protein
MESLPARRLFPFKYKCKLKNILKQENEYEKYRKY